MDTDPDDSDMLQLGIIIAVVLVIVAIAAVVVPLVVLATKKQSNSNENICTIASIPTAEPARVVSLGPLARQHCPMLFSLFVRVLEDLRAPLTTRVGLVG